jgi:hypothetical protein
VPVGIDPSFDYNPGLAWKQGGQAIPVRSPDLVEVRPPGSRNPATPDQIRQFVREPKGEIPVGRLASETQKLLASETDTVMLSDQTMEKQLRVHPDLTPDDYALLPVLLSQPDAVMDDKDLHLLLLLLEDRIWSAVIKTTVDRRQLYVQNFHAMSPKTALRKIKGRSLVLGTLKWLVGK